MKGRAAVDVGGVIDGPAMAITRNLIYALVDPRDGQIRYVGKSTSGYRRPMEHLQPRRSHKGNTKNSNWVNSLLKKGLKPIIRPLEWKEDPNDLYDLERYYVKTLRDSGANLNNLTEGGEGLSGRTHTMETKLKCSVVHGGPTQDVVNLICKMYENGNGISTISNKVEVPPTTVRNALIRNGVKMRTAAEGRTRIDKTLSDEIVTMYMRGVVPSKIASVIGFSHVAVVRVLAKRSKDNHDLKQQIAIRGRGVVLTQEQEKQIASMLLGGETIASIAETFGISCSPVKRIRKEMAGNQK